MICSSHTRLQKKCQDTIPPATPAASIRAVYSTFPPSFLWFHYHSKRVKKASKDLRDLLDVPSRIFHYFIKYAYFSEYTYLNCNRKKQFKLIIETSVENLFRTSWNCHSPRPHYKKGVRGKSDWEFLKSWFQSWFQNHGFKPWFHGLLFLNSETIRICEKAAFWYRIIMDSSYSSLSPFLENAHLQPCSSKSIFMIIVTSKAINYYKFCCMNSFGEYYGYQ